MRMFDEMKAAIDEVEARASETVSTMDAQVLNQRLGALVMGVRLLLGVDYQPDLAQPKPADLPASGGSMMSMPAFARGELAVYRSNVEQLRRDIVG